jgi:hypothetical protein
MTAEVGNERRDATFRRLTRVLPKYMIIGSGCTVARSTVFMSPAHVGSGGEVQKLPAPGFGEGRRLVFDHERNARSGTMG